MDKAAINEAVSRILTKDGLNVEELTGLVLADCYTSAGQVLPGDPESTAMIAETIAAALGLGIMIGANGGVMPEDTMDDLAEAVPLASAVVSEIVERIRG